MKKGISLVGLILIIVCVVCCIVFVGSLKKDGTNENVIESENVVSDANDADENVIENSNVSYDVEINSENDLSLFVDALYSENQELYPSLANQIIDLTDAETVNYMTGLENGDDLEYFLVSEPMMSSQAYSLVIAKVKDGANADKIAKEMCDNINTRKWICVEAEKVYATSSGDIAFLVMSSEEMAKPVYNEFKKRVGQTGEEYERTAEEVELPEDMY